MSIWQFIKQIFCRHKWEHYTESFNGNWVVYKCPKCEHIKEIFK